MNQETPQISNCCYASTSGSPCAIGDLDLYGAVSGNMNRAPNQFSWPPQGLDNCAHQPIQQKAEIIMADKTTRRIVQVFIADPNDNVPLDKSVLYTGEQKLTDLNDTELFFEVNNLQDLIKSHNEVRKSTVDKEASKRAGKDIFLDPVKIRDLKMVVVTVAQF